MKYLFLILGLSLCHVSIASPHLVRQWSRSTLIEPNYHFRHPNRMAPLLTEATVIQGNGTNGIKAFHRNSGHEIWSIKLKNGVEGGAALDGDRLYFGANNGMFYCVDVHSGRELWNFKLNSESLTKPLVHGNFVYHVTGNNTLYSFNKETGQSIWVKTNSAKSNMTVRGQTAPVFEKGMLYLGFSDGTYSAINAINGRELWSKRIGDDKKFNDVDATTVITSKCLLVSSFANSLYCLDKTSGSIQWRHDVGGYNAVLVSDNKIYYPTTASTIDVLDAESGKLLKQIVNIKGNASEIVSLGPYIVYGESSGELVVRDKDKLSVVDSFASGLGLFARPSVDLPNKQIYFVSNDANIFRLDLQDNKSNMFLWGQDKN